MDHETENRKDMKTDQKQTLNDNFFITNKFVLFPCLFAQLAISEPFLPTKIF